MVHESLGSSASSWAGKTAIEIQRIADEPGSIVMIPIASLEQHGHHLPTGTDTIQATAIADKAAEQIGDRAPILVTPPIWSGHSPENMPFGGTVTVGFDTLLTLVEDITTSALENGFDAAVLLNGHGGNRALIESAVATINTQGDHDADVFGVSSWGDLIEQSFLDDEMEDDILLNHAGEFETSLMSHLRPELVHGDRIEESTDDRPYDFGAYELVGEWAVSYYPRSFRAKGFSSTGAFGDIGLASEEKGAQIVQKAVTGLESLLLNIHEQY